MIYAGTSGWSYPHWKNVFYPEALSQRNWLDYYVKFFNCVELNVTFYRLLKKEVFENWYKKTPADFYFIAKGSRFITHIKKLKDIEQPLDLFINNASGLKHKLCVVLWQFPASFKKDVDKLNTFFKLLKKTKLRHSFEFRNQTWFDEQVYELCREYNFCLCIADSDRFPCEKVITADYLYLRFHARGSLYNSNYSGKQLKDWAKFAAEFKKGKDIFAFFNNDGQGFAVKNALKFRELLDK